MDRLKSEWKVWKGQQLKVIAVVFTRKKENNIHQSCLQHTMRATFQITQTEVEQLQSPELIHSKAWIHCILTPFSTNTINTKPNNNAAPPGTVTQYSQVDKPGSTVMVYTEGYLRQGAEWRVAELPLHIVWWYNANTGLAEGHELRLSVTLGFIFWGNWVFV